MTETIKKETGEEIAILDKSDKTYNEAAEALRDALVLLVQQVPQTVLLSQGIIAIMYETLHWMYTKPGEHRSPAEMVQAAIDRARKDKEDRFVLTGTPGKKEIIQ